MENCSLLLWKITWHTDRDSDYRLNTVSRFEDETTTMERENDDEMYRFENASFHLPRRFGGGGSRDWYSLAGWWCIETSRDRDTREGVVVLILNIGTIGNCSLWRQSSLSFFSFPIRRESCLDRAKFETWLSILRIYLLKYSEHSFAIWRAIFEKICGKTGQNNNAQETKVSKVQGDKRRE